MIPILSFCLLILPGASLAAASSPTFFIEDERYIAHLEQGYLSQQLRESILHRDHQALLQAINDGASVNSIYQWDSCRGTPLHLLAYSFGGVLGLAQLLIDHDAPINALDHEGLTPLDRAIFCNNSELKDFLAQRGAISALLPQ